MTRSIAAWLVVAMSLPVWAQSHSQAQPRDSFPITAYQVAQTLAAKGGSLSGGQVSLLANVVAATPYPVLDILAVEPLTIQSNQAGSQLQSIVKLGCHITGVCLPFYAKVTRSEEPASNTAVDSSAPPLVIASAFKSRPAIAMRAGARATLVMDDDRAHIQVAVVTLETGIIGHKIHVASPDRKQTYIAEVVNAHLLKGSF
jgi:hypothetical protein